ncbi:MAG: thiamine-phosphate kinase [Acidobacteria bacterium]|nr:thiamine-phosphate kinase [Acidobacteriota bacterium]
MPGKILKKKELNLVKKIRQKAVTLAHRAGQGVAWPLRLGIGDDAAILGCAGTDQELLITTDLLVEGAHFHRQFHPARALGHKVLARGLSDIAAMGGMPLYAWLSLCLPGWADEKWKNQFWDGLFRLARDCGVTLAGGDLAAGERFAADIVVLGSVRRGRALRRRGAKPGDIIYVSGYLGGSALGFDRLRTARWSTRDPAVHRHLYPSPRLTLGRYLAQELRASSAMDLSDGLSIDLYRLAVESRIGAEIRSADVPVFPGATLDQALHGGEDYELVFTLPPRRKSPTAFQGIPLTSIGVITAGRRLWLVDRAGRKVPLPVKGFQHRL